MLYRFAVAAVVTGSFSLWRRPKFLLTASAAWPSASPAACIREVRARIDDPPTEITISILSGYAAYLPAEELGLSGVIAAVTTGLYMGWHTPQLTTPVMRLQGMAIWEILTFLLNAVLFLLVGLQLPSIMDDLSGTLGGELSALGAARERRGRRRAARLDVLVPYAVAMPDRREAQAPGGAPGRRAARRRLGRHARLGVAGRGARDPAHIDAGGPFPDRELIIFLAFAVILVTLVGQGLTLGPLINGSGVHDDGRGARGARRQAARGRGRRSARIDELGEPDWIRPESVGRARQLFDYRQAALRRARGRRRRRASRSAPMPGGG